MALLFDATPGRAQQKPEAGQECPQNWPTDTLNLAGRLGETEIRAYLHGGHPASTTPDGISGVVFLPGIWAPGASDDSAAFSVSGAITGCQLLLADSNGGVWRVRFTTSQQVQGTREHAGVSLAVSLQVASSVDCSGRGLWRRFDSPGWPIAFEYPESWRLAESGDIITIECPDAASMAFGGRPITLQLGRGEASIVTDDGRPGRRIGRFVTLGKNEWLIGEYCEEREVDFPGCNRARRSAWRGMTVLQGAAGEHRLYRPGGGYVGQGGGIMDYLFMLKNAWVNLRTEDTPASYDDLHAPGTEVIFDGDGVTERLVRSIRVRSR